MNFRYGTCRNQDYCSLAVQRVALRLSPDEAFVCPECARPLSPAAAWEKGGAGWAALLRLVPPLAVVAVGVTAVVLGLRHEEALAPAHEAVKPVAAKRQAAAPLPPKKIQQAVAPPRPRVPAALRVTLEPAPLPPPSNVVLRLAGPAPLAGGVLTELASGYLAEARGVLPVIVSGDGFVRGPQTSDGRTVTVQVKQAGFDGAAITAGRTDVTCTPEAPLAAQLPQGRMAMVALGQMPLAPHVVIVCYVPDGRAGDFVAFLATPPAQGIVASAGYGFPPPPPPPPPPLPPLPAAPPPMVVVATPPPAPPAPKPAASPLQKPAAGVVAKAAPSKPALGPATGAAPSPGPGPGPGPAGAPAPDEADAGDAGGAAAEAPRQVHVAPGSPLEKTLQAMAQQQAQPPQTPAASADGGGPAPHPRTVYLPASARFTYGTYQPPKLPDQPPRLVFVNPAAAQVPGSVKVDCNISTDGVPTDCRELAHKGAAAAAAAILAWLPSGAIRYAPVVKDGRKVAERRVITISFGGDGNSKAAAPQASPGP